MTESTTTPAQAEMLYVQFEQGGHVFKVLNNVLSAQNGEPAFIGYCDDIKSIASDDIDTCARALVRKHIVGLPRGQVVKLADHIAKQFERAQAKGIQRQKS